MQKMNILSRQNFIKFAPLFLVSIFALLRGILYFRQFQGFDYYLGTDEAIYAMLSKRLLAGEFLSFFHPWWNPGFPLMTIPFYLLVGKWEFAQILLAMSCGIAVIFLVYFTMRGISQTLAIISSFITAFSPQIPKLPPMGGWTEPLYILFYWTALYFGWRAVTERKIKLYALTGLFFGLAHFVRFEVAFTAVFYILLNFVIFIFKKRDKLAIFNKITIFALLIAVGIYLYYPIFRIFTQSSVLKLYYQKTPPEGIALIIIFLIIALFGIFFERNKIDLLTSLKHFAIRAAIVFIIFLLVNLPFLGSLSIQFGRPVLTAKDSFLLSYYPFTIEPDGISTWAQDVWAIDYPNYKSKYYNTSKSFTGYFSKISAPLEALPGRADYYLQYYAHNNLFTDSDVQLLFIGVIAGILLKRTRRFVLYVLSLWSFTFFWIALLMGPGARYLAFTFPMVYVGQALAIFGLGTFVSSIVPKYKKILLITTVTIGSLIFFKYHVDIQGFKYPQHVAYPKNKDQAEIGEWLKQEGAEVFLARTEGISYYSGAKMVYLPAATPEEIVKYAKVWGVPYIVARPDESSWEYMRPIADPNYKHPDLQLVHKFDNRTLIWKVNLTEYEKSNNLRTIRSNKK